MTQVAAHLDSAKDISAFDLPNPILAAMGRNFVETLGKMQSELVDNLQEANRRWLDRVRTEADMASEFTRTLTSAHSVPETTTVYQKWAARRMEIAAEDSKRLLADSGKLAEAGMRLFSNGWLRNDHGTGA